MIGGSDAAGAWHELDDDIWIAGNVTAQMISDSAAIEFVGAARPGPHQDGNGFALVEVGDGLGRCGTGRKRCDCKNDQSGDGYARWMQHSLSPRCSVDDLWQTPTLAMSVQTGEKS